MIKTDSKEGSIKDEQKDFKQGIKIDSTQPIEQTLEGLKNPSLGLMTELYAAMDGPNSNVVGGKIIEDNNGGKKDNKYVEFHNDDIDNTGSSQNRVDVLFEKAMKAKDDGDIEGYNAYMKIIKDDSLLI